MSVQYKGGVNFDVVPQIRQAVSQIETIFARYGYVLVITSARDSNHSVGSLHYIGGAVDFRSQGLPSNVKQSIYQTLKQMFPLPTWWFDFEDQGTINEHYHLDYKPAKYAEAEPSQIDPSQIDPSQIDPFAVAPDDIMSSFLPTGQQQDDLSIWFPQPSPPIETPYPQYPPGTIPPQYFTPYELPVDWKILVMAAVAVYLLIEFTD
jgi:hypothetical protein